MDIAGIQSGMVGMALFDSWQAAVEKTRPGKKSHGSPLVAAAAAAFEQYIFTAETQMAAQIAGLSSYALNPTGTGARLLDSSDLAPFLALNILA